jgi:hypothetical protein
VLGIVGKGCAQIKGIVDISSECLLQFVCRQCFLRAFADWKAQQLKLPKQKDMIVRNIK